MSRRWAFPPTAEQFGLYLTKLRELQDNAGALTTAKNALSCIRQLNGVDSSQYNALSVSLSTEGVQEVGRTHGRLTQENFFFAASTRQQCSVGINIWCLNFLRGTVIWSSFCGTTTCALFEIPTYSYILLGGRSCSMVVQS